MNRNSRYNYIIVLNIIGFLILFLSFFLDINAQVRNVSGVLNTAYSAIDSINSYVNTNPDTVFVKSTLGFAVGDTVLVYQSAGARVDRAPGLEGQISDVRNTGRYGIFLVKEVNPGLKMVVLNTSLRDYSKLVTGEMGQLIRVPTFKRVNVSGTLTCDPYNPLTGTGGVLVMLVEQSLTLNANIDVSGKGFPGADPAGDEYGGPCTSTDPAYNKLFYNILSADSSAKKGFGLFDTTFTDRRGRRFATIAGGGGNGLYSGGGGGGHYSDGGDGGIESNSCVSPGIVGGSGGRNMSTWLTVTRVFMGGGGGTGTQKPSISRMATKGGAGGGIIIIVSDTIIGNGWRIISQGESGTGLATAGAGGGGAGGSILLHAFKYNATATTLTIDVKGGNGGDVSTVPPDICGPGGGGSGGVIWYNGLTISGPVSYVTMGGMSGKYGAVPNGAANGGGAVPKNNLIIQIRGFLFNILPDDQVICQDQIPAPINAPPAAGGSGNFTYLWEQSIDKTNWAGASGVRTNPGYIPGVLTDTIYYRRIVDDGIIPKDTSKLLTVFVQPRLNNNTVSPDTTVCSGLTANSIYAPAAITGALGPGSYAYKWEQSANNTTWSDASGLNNDVSYITPVLTDTIYYRRIVTSGECISTSNAIKISVLDPLTGNSISSDQVICNNQVPAGLTGGSLSGGHPGDRTYRWQVNSSGTWNDVAATQNYNPPALNDTTDYRRIVYSGMNNTCESTSNQVAIIVLKDISNNFIINAADSVFCAGLIADSLLLRGTQPAGGDSPDYIYTWQKWLPSQPVWTSVQSVNILQNYNAGVLYDTTHFRRLIFSGANDVCKDTSSVIIMKVLPEIGNNNLTTPQTICVLETPEGLVGSVTTGGDGQIPAYLWQISATPSAPASWQNATGINNDKNYSPPALASTLFYRRIVNSGPVQGTCRDTSTTLLIEVQNDITNNMINNTSPVYTCFNKEPALLIGTTKTSGGLGGGDETNYSYTWHESINGTIWNLANQTRTNPDYQAEALITPKYYRRYVESGACKDTSVMVKIDTTHLPVLFSLTAQDNPVCYFAANPVSQLNITIQEGYAPYVINYSNGQAGTGTANLSGRNGIINPSVNPPSDSILYTYTIDKITDNNGCEATDANLVAFSVPVMVYATPAPLFANKFIEVCDSLLTISPVPGFGTPQWEYISGLSKNMYTPVNFSNSSIDLKANFTLNADFSSEAWLVYREFKANCNSTDSIHAIFYKNPSNIGNIYRVSPDDLVPIGDTLIVFISDNQDLRADDHTLGIPSWTITSGPAHFTGTSEINTSITGLDLKIPSIFEYSIVNGVCPPKIKTVKVIRKDMIIYDGFSPNDDGVNDVLYAAGLYDEEIQFKIQIFSSSGSFIREISRKDLNDFDFARNEVVLWDGTTKIGGADDKIPDGTYYYVLTVDYKGQKFDKKGYFIVKR